MKKWFLLLAFCFASPAWAKPLVADLSNHQININAEFNGTQLLLFGVRNEPGDLVIVVRGPESSFIVRKKSRVGGLWVNKDQIQYDGMPEFYTVASTRPLGNIPNPIMLQSLELGQQNLPLFSESMQPGSELHQTGEAFLRRQRAKRLYSNQTGNLTFMGETLFKTTIDFPDSIPRGIYTAEVYLISDGEIVSMQSTPIEIHKVGLDAFIYDLAHEHSILYGLLAVSIALGAGWAASAAFNRVYA